MRKSGAAAAAVMSLILIFNSMAYPSFAETMEELRQKADENQNKANQLKSERQQAEAYSRTLMESINELDLEIIQGEKEIAGLEDEVKKLNRSIQDKEKDIEKEKQNYEKQKELLKVRLKNMYENGDVSYLEVLFGSKSFTDMFSKYEILKSIMDFDKKLLENIQATKEKIEDQKKLLEIEKGTREAAKIQRVAIVDKLATSRAEKQEYVRRVVSDIDRMKRYEQELANQSAEIEKMIKQLMARSTRKYSAGAMLWPVPGYGTVTSDYGYRTDPFPGFHTGFDVGAPGGADIIAVKSGTVIYSGWQSGYGNTVIVDHGGGISTLYAHASRLLVKYGDEVDADDVIALIGSTGLSTGNHLHFEVRVNGAHTNPWKYLE